MTTSEQRNDSIISSRRRSLERLADSYAAALHVTFSIMYGAPRPTRVGQSGGRAATGNSDERQFAAAQ